MIDLALLGCGGGMPMPNRFLSAIFMNYSGRKILIDCGEGAQVSMRMLGWGFKSIDIICITHCHGDHINGLPGLLGTIGNSGRTKPLTIIGPKGIKNIINVFRVLLPYLPYELNIIEDPREIHFYLDKNEGFLVSSTDKGELEIKTLELDHSADCLGYSFYIKRTPKFDVNKAIGNDVPKKLWNKLQKEKEVTFEGVTYYSNMVLGDERRGIKISYITDSRPLNTMSPFIYESDLFICEGTYGRDEDKVKAIKNKHMTFREAATLAYRGKVSELLLTHFSPSINDPYEFLDNAREVFPNVIIGEDRIIKSLYFEN